MYDNTFSLTFCVYLQFDNPIHTILNRSVLSEPVIIFKNGAAVSLSRALADRKKLWRGHLSGDLSIKECYNLKLGNIYCIAIIAANDKV